MLSVCFEVIYGRNRFSNDNFGLDNFGLNKDFGDPWIVDEWEEQAYRSIRQVSLNYRVGTTIKFVSWLGVDVMYDRPFNESGKTIVLSR